MIVYIYIYIYICVCVCVCSDFGPGTDPTGSFSAQAEMNSEGMSPNMCSEYYSGWLTHWGETMANTSSTELASDLLV